MESLRAGQTWSRYRVDAYLGGGGMADVYLVTHVDLGVHRALKVLKRVEGDLTPRLVREGQVQASLMHPNVVPVLELIQVQGNPALIMDYVDGPSVDGFLAQAEPTLDQIDVIVRGILDGMIAAHAHGVIHRDLKPSNVLIDVRNEPPVARIADFGLAKAVYGEELVMSSTASGMMMGTPRYMAPEQFRDAKNVDQRADVWSMGALLYEMLTGNAAFPGDSLIDTLGAIKTATFRPISELRDDAPPRMVLAVEEALVAELEYRCPSMKALRDLWVGQDSAVPVAHWNVAELRRKPKPLEADDGSQASKEADGSLATAALESMGSVPGAASSLATMDPQSVPPVSSRPTWLWAGLAGGALLALGAGGTWLGVSVWQATDDAAADHSAKLQASLPPPAEPTGVPAAGTLETPAVLPDPAAVTAAADLIPADPIPPVEPQAAAPTPTPTTTPTATLRRTPRPKPPPKKPPADASPTPTADPISTAPTTTKADEAPPEPVGTGRWAAHFDPTHADVRLKASQSGAISSPGEVAAGSYEINARWGSSRTWHAMGPLTISDGQQVDVYCNYVTEKCEVE